MLQLEQRVAKVKNRYSIALRNLERISNQIHAQRGSDQDLERHHSFCTGRSPPVGEESGAKTQEEDGAFGGLVETGKLQVDAAIQLEKYKKEDKERERVGSDSLSVISLQTIASDLEKYDSVEHLGDLSDVSSTTGDEGEKDRGMMSEGNEKLPESSTRLRQQQFCKQHHRSFSL